MIPKKIHLLFVWAAVACAFPTLSAFPNDRSTDSEAPARYHVERGNDYFNKGFYEALPKKKEDEASHHFEQAVSEFQKAIALDKDSVEAHRKLARVYYVQKRYLESAREYRKVTDLMPSDIDAYVLTALAYTRVKQYEQAIERLTAAKGVTDDKAVLEKLDDYITRIEQEQRSVDEK